jgi:ribosomal protein L17
MQPQPPQEPPQQPQTQQPAGQQPPQSAQSAQSAQPAQPAQPPTPQPVQAPRGFPWWAILSLILGGILLIGLFAPLVINAFKDNSQIIQIETKEDFYLRARNFDKNFIEREVTKGLEIYKREVDHRHTVELVQTQNQFIIDTMKIRLEQQRAVELQKEIERLHKEVKAAEAAANRAAARAAEARNAVRQVKSAAPAPPPPAPTVVEGTLVIGIENRSPYIIRVTADKIPGSWTIKPGDEVLLPPLPKATDVSVRAEYLKRGKKIGEYTQVIPANLFNQKLCITRGGRVVDVVVFFGWN